MSWNRLGMLEPRAVAAKHEGHYVYIEEGYRCVSLPEPIAIALRDWLNAEFPATVDNGTPGNSSEGMKMEALP